MLEIFGAKSKTRKLASKAILDYISDQSKLIQKNGIMIQLLDADLIFGPEHIISAYDHAVRAINQHRATSSSLAMELLLYASGEYQIKNALNKLGLKDDTKNIAFVFASEDEKNRFHCRSVFEELCNRFGLEPDDSVLAGDKTMLQRFGITTAELDAVPEDKWFELVLEKVALVDIKK